MHKKLQSPDDPGYLDRLKGQPPLDEWVDPASPSWWAQMAKERRRERNVQRAIYWIIAALIAACAAYAIVNADSEPAGSYNDDIQLCQDNFGTHEC